MEICGIICGNCHFLRQINTFSAVHKSSIYMVADGKSLLPDEIHILVHNNIDMLNGVLTVYRYIMIQRNILLHMKRCT